MKIKSQFFKINQNFKTNMNMQFSFFQLNWDKVCVSVSHTPKLKLHVVPNVCIKWKDLTWGMKKLVGIGVAQNTPPNLNSNTLVLEKENTNIIMENKKNNNKQ